MGSTIVIIDDNKSVLSSVENYLKENHDDWKIVTAASGEELFGILKTEEADLIVLDIEMPNLDGWQISARLHRNKDWSNIPLILMSTKSDELTKQLAGKVSNDFIEKPFELEDLDNRIKKQL